MRGEKLENAQCMNSRLVPYWEKPKTLWGIDRGKFEILGDIIEPIDVEWEAETGKIRDGDK